jgi:hypothetical protein
MVRADEDALTQAIIDLASEYGRYAYRRITWLLKDAGWVVGTERVQRGAARGLKFPVNKGPGTVCGSTMGLVSGGDRNGVTTSGLTTLSKPYPVKSSEPCLLN